MLLLLLHTTTTTAAAASTTATTTTAAAAAATTTTTTTAATTTTTAAASAATTTTAASAAAAATTTTTTTTINPKRSPILQRDIFFQSTRLPLHRIKHLCHSDSLRPDYDNDDDDDDDDDDDECRFYIALFSALGQTHCALTPARIRCRSSMLATCSRDSSTGYTNPRDRERPTSVWFVFGLFA